MVSERCVGPNGKRNRALIMIAVLSTVLMAVCSTQAQSAKPLGIDPEQVQRVEILYFPERIEVRAALTPERLQQLYQYKLEIKDVRETTAWKELLPILQSTSVRPPTHSSDHRTAVLLFDRNGKRVASIYFGQFGTTGTMNGTTGTITGGMYKWAKSLLKGVDE